MQTSVELVSCNGSKVRENNLSVPCRLIPLNFCIIDNNVQTLSDWSAWIIDFL